MDGSRQAVVLGGGIAGMLAARVLADTFEQVTIIERHADRLADSLNSGPQHNWRPVGPAQTLSGRARPQLARLFPDLLAELTTDGAAIVGADRDGAQLQFTKQFIQRHLSRRLTSLDAIATLRGQDAMGLVSDGGRCVGAQILPRSHSAAARRIPADLVVDAMGAGSRLSVWLDDIWRIRVPSDREQIPTYYASRLYRLPSGSLPGAVTIDLRPTHPYRISIMAVEDGNHLVTVAGPRSAPLNRDQFSQLVSAHLPPTAAAAIANARPVGPARGATSARFRRRRFDRAHHLPQGIVALGSSVCSFDPFSSRDLEVAIFEAAALVAILGDQHWCADGSRPIEFSRRYFRAVMQILDGTHTIRLGSRTEDIR